MGLIDLIDEEVGVAELGAAVMSAPTPTGALRAEVALTRAFQERCGDVIGALFAAAAAEPDLGVAVGEGRRRHREGARLAVQRLAELRGLRDDLTPERAAALIALSTNHEAWRELVEEYRLSWDEAEALLTAALGRALQGFPREALALIREIPPPPR